MIQFNKIKLLYKSIEDTTSFKGDVDVASFTINKDLLASSSTDITVYAVPNNLNIGDLVVLMNWDGTNLFSGVVAQIEENKITCSDLSKILDVEVCLKPGESLDGLYVTKLAAMINIAREQCSYYQELGGDLKIDKINQVLYNQLLKNYSKGLVPQEYHMDGSEDVYNLRDVMFDMAAHGLYTTLDCLIRPENGSYFKLLTDSFKDTDKQIDDYSTDVLNSDVTIEESEINKLMIFDDNAGSNRPSACYYLAANGITNNPDNLTRSLVTKNKIVWREANQSYSDVVTENLAPFLYNHKIELTVAYDGNYVDWENYNLGEKVKVVAKGNTYDSIYTGQTIEYSENSGVTAVKMTFGKVRNKASQRWFQKAWASSWK